MLDTVILTIPQQGYKITDHSRFHPNTEKLEEMGNMGFSKFINNPTTMECAAHYYPRLTINKRGFEQELKIEFSIQKILFGNSIEEETEDDLNKVVETLHQRIKEMGVLVHSKESITFADVQTIHVSKNVVLTNGYTANYVIRELYKIDLHGKLDLTQVKFKNSGHSLQCYASTHQLVFYDKYAETFLSKKKRVDSEDKFQPDLFNVFPEILRMEMRIVHKGKLNATLKHLGYATDPLFKDVFRKELCQKILQHYWHTIVTDKNQFLFHPLQEPQRLYALIKQNHHEVPNKELDRLIGLYVLSRDRGIREFRTLVEKHNSKKTWVRTKEDIRKLDKLMPTDSGIGFISEIERTLDEFNPYKPDFSKNYPLGM